jgi:GxxExxY protein
VLWEQPVPIRYDGIEFDEGFKLDLWVNRLVIVEAKSVTEMHPVFRAQVLSHRKLMEIRLGFLINF